MLQQISWIPAACFHCRLLGHSRMKHRHLRALGWKVVSVPYHKWDELLGPTEKQEYLQDRMDAVQ